MDNTYEKRLCDNRDEFKNGQQSGPLSTLVLKYNFVSTCTCT